MKYILRDYQSEAIDFILQNKACGILLDIGMGKTVVALTAVQILLYDYFEMPKILVVTSKILADNIWIPEIRKWDHLQSLKYSIIMGREHEKKAAIKKCADIYITNKENISWIVKNNLWTFDTLILDEFYKYKNEKSKCYKNLLIIRPQIKRIVGLSAMPIANGLSDIWALSFLLDGGKRLGRSRQAFLERYFFTEYKVINQKCRLCREEKRGAKEAIYSIIKDMFFCKEFDTLGLNLIYKNYCIEMSPNEYSKYYILESNLLTCVNDNNLSKKSSLKKMSILLQAANGIWAENPDEIYELHARKMAALDRIVQEDEESNILIACWFLKDRDRIINKYPQAVLLESIEQINEWNHRKNRIGIINPTSNAAKLQLAKGTDILIWYSLPWSLEIYKKLNSRITGDGKSKIVINIIMMATIEEKMLLLLKKKNLRQETMISYLDSTSIKEKNRVSCTYNETNMYG